MRINEAIHVCNVIPTTKAGTNNWRNTLYDNRKQLASWLKELVRLRKENRELRQQLETMLWEECDCDNCGENIVGSPAYRIGQ